MGGLIARCGKCGKGIDPSSPPYIMGIRYDIKDACGCWFKDWHNVPLDGCLFVVKERKSK